MAVSLQKGQKISLDKEAGTALTRIKMGLGWDVAFTPDLGKVAARKIHLITLNNINLQSLYLQCL